MTDKMRVTDRMRFRVYWNGKMYYPGNDQDLPIFWYLTLDGECYAFPAKMGVRFDPAIYEGAVAMQRTGIQDRQGCDIYDGDIISFKPPASFDQDRRTKGVVMFVSGRYVLVTAGHDMNVCQQNMDVVGNIYQNMSPLVNYARRGEKETPEST